MIKLMVLSFILICSLTFQLFAYSADGGTSYDLECDSCPSINLDCISKVVDETNKNGSLFTDRKELLDDFMELYNSATREDNFLLISKKQSKSFCKKWQGTQQVPCNCW